MNKLRRCVPRGRWIPKCWARLCSALPSKLSGHVPYRFLSLPVVACSRYAAKMLREVACGFNFDLWKLTFESAKSNFPINKEAGDLCKHWAPVNSVWPEVEAVACWLLLCSSHPQSSACCGYHTYNWGWVSICDGGPGRGQAGGWFSWKTELHNPSLQHYPKCLRNRKIID